ncbi:hypothetical protein Tco_0753702 [Tanacetum coccineum]
MPSSSTVTYTSVYTDFEPGRVFWRAGEELSDRGSPRVIVYGYDGLLMQPVALPSPDYVPGPEHPPSPDYPEYPEYLVPSDAEAPLEDQPLPAEPQLSPCHQDMCKAFETDKSAPIPRSPQIRVPFAQTRLRRARKTVILKPPMSPSMEARIAKYAAIPTPPSPPPSLLSHWSSPLPHIPSPPLPPPPSLLHLPPPGPISLPLPSSPLPSSLSILPPVDHREDVPEVKLPPHKRLCLTTPTSRYEVGESLTDAPRPIGGHRADMGLSDLAGTKIYSMVGEDEFHDDNPPPPPPVPPTQQAPHTLSTIKLPILKKGEYDIWAMKMEHYVGHTNYPIREVIQKGNGPIQVSTDINGKIRVLPPKTAEKILARERERKARTTLLMSIPEDHLAKFHKMTDAKEMWEAIKSRFGGNDKSKKMQKYILKKQFESFSVSNSEGLHKGYDRFWSLLSQLEIHGAGVSTEDANKKFLRVFESDVKCSTASSSSTQNVAFVSSESTSSTNDYSFFANQSSGPQLDHEDIEQVDEFDLEEIDLKWQVAMISMRLKKFYKNTGRKLQFDAKEPVGFDKTKVEYFNFHNTWHFAKECISKGNQESKRRDAGNTRYKAKDNGRRPGKQEEPKALAQTLREQLGDASIEIQAYTQALKKVEAQLVCQQQNQLVYKEKIRFMKIDLDDKTNVLTYHKKLLAEAIKEKEELKTKLENFQSSSKGLSKLLNSRMSAKDKSGLGYGDQIHEGVLSYENEVLESVFDSRSSDVEDSHLYDRFAKVERMHTVPPPMTGIYMPPKFDFGIDESNFTYGLKQSKTSEYAANTSD